MVDAGHTILISLIAVPAAKMFPKKRLTKASIFASLRSLGRGSIYGDYSLL